MKKQLLVLASLIIVASMILAACATPTPQVVEVTSVVKETQVVEVTSQPAAPEDRVEIRWFVGLGTGTNADQQKVQREVVEEFNASQDKIYLVLEVVPYDSARNALSTEIASGNAPDIVGPVGWGGSNDFYGQWLDMSSYIADSGFDTSIFNPALVEMYQTEEGQVGLPFLVFPAAVYYNPALFDEAGLAYPPANYGEKYNLNGQEVEWSWDTMIQVAKLLTIDKAGKNATEEGFDKAAIAQYGFTHQWAAARAWTGFTGGQEFYKDGKAVINDAAKYAFQVHFDGMWGDQPYKGTAPALAAPEFGSGGGEFASGKVAMAITHAWYLCCVSDLVKAGGTFQYGILPSYNGTVYGRVDADTYRIMKSSKHPAEAFTALTYLISVADVKLSTVYGGFPAITAHQQSWLDAKKEAFPFVTTWDTLIAGLAYPDKPSAEGWFPNSIEANTRIGTFQNLISTDGTVDLAAEIQKLQDDLQVIFDKKP